MPDRRRLLELALKGLEAERAKIDDEIAQVKSQLNSHPRANIQERPAGATQRKKRTMSAAARKKISEAMKRRYVEMRKAKS
jgi:hypothetical protein